MSGHDSGSRSLGTSALDTVVEEARRGWVPPATGAREHAPANDDARWAKLEAAIQRDAAPKPAARRGRFLRYGLAIGATAAAAAAVWIGVGATNARRAEPSLEVAARGVQADAPPREAPRSDAEVGPGAIVATVGTGELRVGGAVARTGETLREGDALEARGMRALVERPGKVQYAIEPNAGEPLEAARVRVARAGETLVLALDQGAVEAKVTPVPAGEAFAVDVTAGDDVVRVAVHGTHLRVARFGTRVVVDLSEGVVAVGRPPREGRMPGPDIAAPAHIELDLRDPSGSLRVDREPSRVRPPIDLSPSARAASRRSAPTDPGSPTTRGASGPASQAVAEAPPRRPSPEPERRAPGKQDPREVIAAAIKACALEQRRPSDVRISVKTSLRLTVSESGIVQAAHFDPPLEPSVQACAARTIFRTTVERASAGVDAVTVPVDFSY